MKVFVKVFASLRDKYPTINDLNPLVMDLEKGITVRDLILKLGFEEKQIHLIILNGKNVKIDSKIEEEDSIIALFPPVGGG